MMKPLHLVLCLTVALAACSGGSKSEKSNEAPKETPETTEETTGTTEETTPAVDENMLNHWVYVTQIRDQVVMGDLEGAIAHGETARGDESPVTGEQFDPLVADMDLHLSAVFSADSLADAASSTAKLGATCGKCHAAAGADIALSEQVAPPEGDDSRAHMQRHQWAVNAMWQGLVAPDDGRWQDGARIFTDMPLHPAPDEETYEGMDQVKALADKIHEVGTRANAVSDIDERAELFGELIATCGTCHGSPTTPQ